MARRRIGPLTIGLAIALSSVAGCDGERTAGPVEASFDDPFAYCAAIGTADMPGPPYLGPAVPDEVIAGYLHAVGLESTTEPVHLLRASTTWRCMDHSVYVCNIGANLPCAAKADVRTTPSAETTAFCAADPDADVVPASVTGRETVFSWRCVGGIPEAHERIDEADAAGFLSRIWYLIEREQLDDVRPTGQLLFSSDRGGSISDVYLLDLAVGEAIRLTDGESNTFPGPFAPDGGRFAFTSYGPVHSFIGTMATDGGEVRRLTRGDTDDTFPAWSPDGTQIAFTRYRDGSNDIYIMAADGSGVVRLTNDPADNFSPAWSPDGSRIAFVSDRSADAGHTDLYVMNVDGSDVVRLTSGPAIDFAPAWSPEGSRIAFRSHHDGPADIYTVSPDGSGLERVTDGPADDWAPAWSPDGRWLAFQTDRDGQWEIYAAAVDGSTVVNLTGHPANDQMPHWRPTATRVDDVPVD